MAQAEAASAAVMGQVVAPVAAVHVMSASEEDELDNLDRELDDEIDGGDSFDSPVGKAVGIPEMRRLGSNDN